MISTNSGSHASVANVSTQEALSDCLGSMQVATNVKPVP